MADRPGPAGTRRPETLLAEAVFSPGERDWFAAVSGDRNPLHTDPLEARRSLAGRAVVHGVHRVVWGLESFFSRFPDGPPVGGLRVAFEKPLVVGDAATAVLVRHDATGARIEVRCGEATTAVVALSFAPPAERPDVAAGPPVAPAVPLVRRAGDVAGAAGSVPALAAAASLVERLPATVAALGLDRVRGLIATSHLVGMVCPGRYSLFRGLDLAAAEDPADGLRFAVTQYDDRFRLVRMAVAGSGWRGTVDAHLRPEPVEQPTAADVAGRVVGGEFAGIRALVVGGSRGLGEVVGKILAAGGADVRLTYAVGAADAGRVRDEIRAGGGRCEIAALDVVADRSALSGRFGEGIEQIYYMATPMIAKGRPGRCDADVFDALAAVHVWAFQDLVNEIVARGPTRPSVFYPSTVYVDEPPDGLAEYAMAKAAGEVAAAAMRASGRFSAVVVERLPRLATDQTASLRTESFDDTIDVLLPIVRRMRG